MNVYILYYDNGEPYEDAYTNVDSVYATPEAARKAMRDKGYTVPIPSRPISKDSNARRKQKEVCPHNLESLYAAEDKCEPCEAWCPYIYDDESNMYYVEMEVKE